MQQRKGLHWIKYDKFWRYLEYLLNFRHFLIQPFFFLSLSSSSWIFQFKIFQLTVIRLLMLINLRSFSSIIQMTTGVDLSLISSIVKLLWRDTQWTVNTVFFHLLSYGLIHNLHVLICKLHLWIAFYLLNDIALWKAGLECSNH